MVIKFSSQPDEVFLLESTGQQGVSIKSYSDLRLSIGTFFTKLALRHLDWQDDGRQYGRDQGCDVLEKFLQEVVGRDFEFRIKYLIKNRVTVNI